MLFSDGSVPTTINLRPSAEAAMAFASMFVGVPVGVHVAPEFVET